MYVKFAAACRRCRMSGDGVTPPSNVAVPQLAANGNWTALTYTAGVWEGTSPISVLAKLFIDGVEVGEATSTIVIDPSWVGKTAYVQETATGPEPGPVIAESAPLVIEAQPTLAEQVEAILAVTGGFALDPSDLSTMWQDSAKTLRVTGAAQPVGAIRTKWGNSQFDFLQATVANRPAWDGAGALTYDNTDDFVAATNVATFQNAPAAFVCVKMRPKSVNLDKVYFFSNNAQTALRMDGLLQNNGFRYGARRLDSDPDSLPNTGSPTIVAGQDYTVSHIADFAGTGALTCRLNGTPYASTIGGAIGPTSNTPSATVRLGRLDAAVFDGQIGRLVAIPVVPTQEQLETIEAWVSEVIAAPTLSDQVAAILAGTNGWALDPSDISTMYQDGQRTIPVTAPGDPVGSIRTKWGTTAYDWRQGNTPSMPLWDGVAGLDYDGVDDNLRLGLNDILQNRAAAFVCEKFVAKSFVGAPYSVYFSTNTVTPQRFSFPMEANGRAVLGALRLDGGSATFLFGTAGDITVAKPHVLSYEVDYATTGDGRLWRDGALIISGKIAGTPGNTSNTQSNLAILASLSTTQRFKCRKGRMVFCPFIPTAEQRATIEAWVNEVPLELTLSEKVEAILSGTNGFAIDPTDASTKFQTNNDTIPWTADGEPVGRIKAKWGNAPPTYGQGTSASRPVGTSRYIEGDGVNDSLIATAAVPAFQNSPASAIFMKHRRLSGTAGRWIIGFQLGGSANERFALAYQAGPFLQAVTRRLDADAAHSDNAASGSIALNVDYLHGVLADWAGTGEVKARQDKAAFASGDFPSIRPGTPANVSNTASAGAQIFSHAGTIFYHGRIGRVVVTTQPLTADQISTIEAWIDEGGSLA